MQKPTWLNAKNVIITVACIPLVALGLPSAFTVAGSATHLPLPIAVVLGVAFESVYFGALFLTMARGWIYFNTVITAVACAMLYNILYGMQVYGLLDPARLDVPAKITLAVVHGAPIPYLAFVYATLIKSSLKELVARREAQAQAQAVTVDYLEPVRAAIQGLQTGIVEIGARLQNTQAGIAQIASETGARFQELEARVIESLPQPITLQLDSLRLQIPAEKITEALELATVYRTGKLKKGEFEAQFRELLGAEA